MLLVAASSFATEKGDARRTTLISDRACFTSHDSWPRENRWICFPTSHRTRLALQIVKRGFTEDEMRVALKRGLRLRLCPSLAPRSANGAGSARSSGAEASSSRWRWHKLVQGATSSPARISLFARVASHSPPRRRRKLQSQLPSINRRAPRRPPRPVCLAPSIDRPHDPPDASLVFVGWRRPPP